MFFMTHCANLGIHPDFKCFSFQGILRRNASSKEERGIFKKKKSVCLLFFIIKLFCTNCMTLNNYQNTLGHAGTC